VIQGKNWVVHVGNNLDILPTLPDKSVDSIVTDPPYELGFMGKKWDNSGIAYNVELWKECLRVLKPGGHLLSFGGTRTWHRVAVAIEDAGFEVRDSIAWMYGVGFPKSLNVGKNDSFCQCSVEWSYGTASEIPEHSLRPMSDSHLSSAINSENESGEVLQSSLPKQGLPSSVRAKSKEGLEDGKEPSLERWGDSETTTRELQGCEVCQMSERISANGTERRLHNGASFSDGSDDWENANKAGSCESHRSQSKQQSPEQSGTLPNQRRSQTRRSGQVCDRCGKQNWEGWGTALKPAFEPIVVARKPLIGTVAENVLTYGTGALNIDASRIRFISEQDIAEYEFNNNGAGRMKKEEGENLGLHNGGWKVSKEERLTPQGRWPANVILDEYSAELLDEQSGITKSGKAGMRTSDGFNKTAFGKGIGIKAGQENGEYGDSGGASRFFYVAKASKRDRNEGLDELPLSPGPDTLNSGHREKSGSRSSSSRQNFHPTVKPTELMKYLIKLVTPPNGTVLDPFTGSGSTGKAALLQGFSFIGIEMTEDYIPIIEGRLRHAEQKLDEGLF
jgi:DNA modification methylase